MSGCHGVGSGVNGRRQYNGARIRIGSATDAAGGEGAAKRLASLPEQDPVWW